MRSLSLSIAGQASPLREEKSLSAAEVSERVEEEIFMTVQALVPVKHDAVAALFEQAIECVREDLIENPYIIEALRVLPVRGYRSAIGSVWNAVVDDLRNKILHRSLKLFNKAVTLRREVKDYDDFQDFVRAPKRMGIL
jgi:hypothetical protein